MGVIWYPEMGMDSSVTFCSNEIADMMMGLKTASGPRFRYLRFEQVGIRPVMNRAIADAAFDKESVVGGPSISTASREGGSR